LACSPAQIRICDGGFKAIGRIAAGKSRRLRLVTRK
jgi:hypothetical protein